MKGKDDIFYIEKVKSGQTAYFSYLVEKYQDIVFSIAFKVLKNREDAEEMAQESFIKAYQALNSFKGTAKFSTWLYRIVYNNCISEVRKKKQHYISTDDIEVKDESDNLNLDGLPEENRSRYIKLAMDELATEEYTLIMLYYFEERSIEEITKILKFSNTNVTKSKKYQCKKSLESVLQEQLQPERRQ